MFFSRGSSFFFYKSRTPIVSKCSMQEGHDILNVFNILGSWFAREIVSSRTKFINFFVEMINVNRVKSNRNGFGNYSTYEKVCTRVVNLQYYRKYTNYDNPAYIKLSGAIRSILTKRQYLWNPFARNVDKRKICDFAKIYTETARMYCSLREWSR